MYSFSEVNKSKNIGTLSISQIDGVTLDSEDSNEIEDICNPKYNEYKYQTLFPPNAKFLTTFKYWSDHMACFWSIHENDPSVDRAKFMTAPIEFQKIVLCNIGCIMIGDSIVLDCLSSDIRNMITSIELKAMFADQESRELIHKVMYSKMLEISSNADEYRSEEFMQKYMWRFRKKALEYRTNDIRIQMFFIMMCENILFAPMFQTICYLAQLGYAPRSCDLNLLVMRDEYIHYLNARHQSSQFKKKIDVKLALRILQDFVDLTEELCREIVGNYSDNIYNIDHVLAHFRHVVHGFRLENDLYDNFEEFSINQQLYTTSPAEYYMNLPKCESKINHMESNSTIYNVPGNNVPVDMSF
ncbi:ribonucleotide reductase small subunit [Esparto virus]|uniref:ribonucleoside-diphosphate reductase n=1 Tax=Esparto virus TaxID=2072209 RepID=A0A2I7G2X4_9VIRU|nr:ribonucleotide reductase small subunit [Esparto virus]AUQ43983.1 ribonucleotide reductase small subunit [Esparto virus]